MSPIGGAAIEAAYHAFYAWKSAAKIHAEIVRPAEYGPDYDSAPRESAWRAARLEFRWGVLASRERDLREAVCEIHPALRNVPLQEYQR